MATQLMAPPSLARVPQIVPRYSSHLGALYPRWVRSRWKVTPIPIEPESHHKNNRVPRPAQVKCQKAVAAIAWITPKYTTLT